MEEKKNFKLYQKWWFWLILLMIFLISFTILIFINNNNKDNNYKKQAITILEQYKNGNLTNRTASEKLSDLSKRIDKEPKLNDSAKSATRLALKSRISLLSLELFNGELSDTEIDNYIKDFKRRY